MFGLNRNAQSRRDLEEARRRDDALRRVETVTDDLCANARDLKRLVRRLREEANSEGAQ